MMFRTAPDGHLKLGVKRSGAYRWALALVMLVSATAVTAQSTDTTTYDRFSLSAEAHADVPNELLTVNLEALDQHQDPATLANSINAKMQWALSIVKRYDTLDVKTLNYNTWPRYSKGTSKIIGWHARQQLQIQSEDIDITQKVIQLLQEKLTIANMQMVATNEARESLEDELISVALERFKDRASIIQRNMGALGYRIVSVDINADNNRGGMIRHRTMASDMAMMEAPAIEGGTSELTVRVYGHIELQ